MNSKAASAFAYALSIGSVMSLHGKICVGSPKGSAPLPQNECQYAEAKRRCSYMDLPATTLFSSDHLKASGLSESFPSEAILPMPLYTSDPVAIIFFYFIKINYKIISNVKKERMKLVILPLLVHMRNLACYELGFFSLLISWVLIC